MEVSIRSLKHGQGLERSFRRGLLVRYDMVETSRKNISCYFSAEAEQMKAIFTNATVSRTEFEIARRESLIREIPLLLIDTWRDLNPAVKMERCESPILVPRERLESHIAIGLDRLVAIQTSC